MHNIQHNTYSADCSGLGLLLAPTSTGRRGGARPGRLLDLSILRQPAFLLVMAANIPTVMAVYTTYSYMPAVGLQLE